VAFFRAQQPWRRWNGGRWFDGWCSDGSRSLGR
jgi:hypothetical protein